MARKPKPKFHEQAWAVWVCWDDVRTYVVIRGGRLAVYWSKSLAEEAIQDIRNERPVSGCTYVVKRVMVTTARLARR